MPAAPSLLIVPYRSKTGKLYSQIPTSGAGDFTVTRNTTATRFNSAGLIESVASGIPRLDYYTSGGTAGCPALLVEPSGSNLLLQSEAFNTSWSTQAGATVTPNTIAAPDNNVTADTINLTTTSESRVQQGSITIANSTTYTMSCFYKNIALTAGQTFRMRFNNTNSAPNNFIATAVIDLAAGTSTYSIGGTSGTGFSGTATGRVDNYGNGWYRISMTFTAGTAGGTSTGIFEAGNNTSGAARSFYAWGAQFETGSVATSYIPTTTAAVTRNADVVTLSGAVSGCIGQTEGTLYAEIVAQPYNNASFPAILQVDDGADSQRFAIFIHASGGIRVRLNASGINLGIDSTNPATLVVGQTYKIAAAFGFNGSQALYINGVFQVSGSVTAGPFTAALNRVMLGHRGGISSPFLIRSAALYTTRLTNAELATLTTL